MTIFEHFQKIGLAYSNCILQRAGMFIRNCGFTIDGKINERQDQKIYMVNDYLPKDDKRIQTLILKWATKPPRSERAAIREWWKWRKQLPQ